MSLLEELLPASFKGVGFLLNSSSITGGRKDVRHSFPNSNRQTIEDLGLAPRVFEIEASITGVDYIQKRNDFLRVIEEGGPGTFIHPLYGRLENYVARSYTERENLNSLGDARIRVTFEISDEVGIPVEAETSLNVINKANDAFLVGITSDIAANYNVTPSFLGNFGSAVDKANDMVTAFNDNTSFLQVAADEINEFSRKVSTFEANITSLVQQPQALADSITSVFITIDNLYPTVSDTLAVLAGFFNFGNSDVDINTTTAGLSERKNNNDILNLTMQSVSLSYSYLNAAQIDYVTTDEVEEVADDLELQYQNAISADGLTDETKSLLTDLRLESQKFFDQQKLTARQVLDVQTNLTSARLLAYQYYGDSEQGEALALLNDVADVAFIEGDVKVLTA